MSRQGRPYKEKSTLNMGGALGYLGNSTYFNEVDWILGEERVRKGIRNEGGGSGKGNGQEEGGGTPKLTEGISLKW